MLVYPLICHLYVIKLEHTQHLVGDVRREIVADDDDEYEAGPSVDYTGDDFTQSSEDEEDD